MGHGEQKRRIVAELRKIKYSFEYFLQFCEILNWDTGQWFPFNPWPKQQEVARLLQTEKLVVALKARQLGFTWLARAKALYNLITIPNTRVLLFSKRDTEAVDSLEMCRKMYERIARRYPWLAGPLPRKEKNNDHTLTIENGSQAIAFPTTGGDSYTASLVLIDEADLVPDFNALLRAVKPTIDAGGQLFVFSRADKSNPASEFKNLYRNNRQGGEWRTIFAPWNSRPERTEQWYEKQKNEILTRTGSLDDLYEQYPATDTEALQARTQDKRIPLAWIEKADDTLREPDTCDELPFAKVWGPLGGKLVIGADPAEGVKGGDLSAAVGLDEETGEQRVEISARSEPNTFADMIIEIGKYYDISVLCERNNHGHLVIERLRDAGVKLLKGLDGKRGWLSNAKGKAAMYATAAEACRDEEMKLRSFETLQQLGSIERATLLAPKGMRDDSADAAALAAVGRRSKLLLKDIGHVEIF